MNTIGDDNDSNLDEPTGYEYETETTGMGDTETGLDDTATQEKPAKSKKGLFIAGGAVAALALVGGFFVLSGDSSPPPRPATQTAVIDDEAVEEDFVDEEEIVEDRFGGSQLQDSTDPFADLNQDDDMDRFGPAPTPTDSFGNPVDQGVATLDDPFANDLLPPSIDSIYEGVQDEVQDGMVGLESVEEVEPQVMDEEYQDSVQSPDLTAQVTQPTQDLRSFDVPRSNEIQVDHLAQFRDMLSPLDGRVTTLEGKVDTLEKTVARIDSQLKNMPRASTSRSSSSSTSSKPSTSTRSTRSTRSDNVIRVAPPVSRVQLDSNGHVISVTNNPSSNQPVTVTQVASKVAASPSQSCDVQAIVPGRVWVKNPDGSFQSYGEDDKWNGQSIESIDPNRGIKAGGKWHCM